MCVITNSKWIDDLNRRKAKKLAFEGVGESDCGCLSETGFHHFEPYYNEFSKMLKVDELIRDLEKLIDDIKEWRRDAL